MILFFFFSRIGRSGRFGRKGVSINLITTEDQRTMNDIEAFYNTSIEEMPMNIADLIQSDPHSVTMVLIQELQLWLSFKNTIFMPYIYIRNESFTYRYLRVFKRILSVKRSCCSCLQNLCVWDTGSCKYRSGKVCFCNVLDSWSIWTCDLTQAHKATIQRLSPRKLASRVGIHIQGSTAVPNIPLSTELHIWIEQILCISIQSTIPMIWTSILG